MWPWVGAATWISPEIWRSPLLLNNVSPGDTSYPRVFVSCFSVLFFEDRASCLWRDVHDGERICETGRGADAQVAYLEGLSDGISCGRVDLHIGSGAIESIRKLAG